MSKELIKKYQKKNTSEYFCFDAFDVVVLLFKKQNKKLLNMIGKYKNLDEDEIEDFLNDFLKIGFYMPHITKNKYEEDIQVHIIKKKIKKIKQCKNI
jgi:hypothetical protein